MSNNYMGSNTEKNPWTNLQNSCKNLSKEIKSDNFCYHKVGRMITKSNIAIPILKKLMMDGIIIISHFDGRNNIFANWTYRRAQNCFYLADYEFLKIVFKVLKPL